LKGIVLKTQKSHKKRDITLSKIKREILYKEKSTNHKSKKGWGRDLRKKKN
jgi:hypothetical protein